MVRFIVCSIIILLSLVKQALTESLATSFDGPNGDDFADGDKFSIITGSTAVSIERFDIHMAAVTKTVEIWTKDGYPNWWNDNTWTKIWEGTIVGQGQGVATPLPALSSPIEVAANSVLGVYTLLDDYAGNNMYHSTGVLGQNQVFVSDSYISIGEGISSWHMHANFQQPTRWNGVVYYSSELSPSIAPSLSSLPTLQPSSYPSTIPTEATPTSLFPTIAHSIKPTVNPTTSPSLSPTKEPSKSPDKQPDSPLPSLIPSTSGVPSNVPSINPSLSGLPSSLPSQTPTTSSQLPTSSMIPSSKPSFVPSVSELPSMQPTSLPSHQSSTVPSLVPTSKSSDLPSSLPSIKPTLSPSVGPSVVRTMQPSAEPSFAETNRPSSTSSTSSTSESPSEEPSLISFKPSAEAEVTQLPSMISISTEWPSTTNTVMPSSNPTKAMPTSSPTNNANSVSFQPSQTGEATRRPTSVQFIRIPTMEPTTRTWSPTMQPSSNPSLSEEPSLTTQSPNPKRISWSPTKAGESLLPKPTRRKSAANKRGSILALASVQLLAFAFVFR